MTDTTVLPYQGFEEPSILTRRHTFGNVWEITEWQFRPYVNDDRAFPYEDRSSWERNALLIFRLFVILEQNRWAIRARWAPILLVWMETRLIVRRRSTWSLNTYGLKSTPGLLHANLILLTVNPKFGHLINHVQADFLCKIRCGA